MSSPSDDNWPGSDEVLGRADALLTKHRATGLKAVSDPEAVPILTEAVVPSIDAQAIPTLTDIVAVPAHAPTIAFAPVSAAASGTTADSAGTERARGPTQTQSGEVISRVQTQNLEHSVYQKLKRGLDTQIAQALEQRFMPELAGALD